MGVENDSFVLWIEINSLLVRRSKLICFFMRGSDLTWLMWGMANDLFLVFGSKVPWVMRGIELDLISG